jgi:DNA-binding response OmpR family regulator
LIVDDEVANRYSISKSLQKVGLMTSEAGNADEALEMLTEGEYDVVLTDIKMPGSMDGVELLRHIRTESPDAVVILMTGYASLPSAVEALRLGAHDYFIKPGSMHDLRNAVQRGVERARTQRRRKLLMDSIQHNLEELTRDGAVRAEVGQAALAGVGAGAGGGMGGRWAEPEAQVTATVRLGALTVFPGSYQISTGERAVDLTPTEFDLLMYLGTNSGRVVPCHELVREVRSYAVDEAEAREVIRPHISNLRRKLKAAGQNPDLIVNVRGLGYRLNDRAR